MAKPNSDNFSYEIEKQIGVIHENQHEWKLELNSISWNGYPAKYDIRWWSPDNSRMGKGLSMNKEELLALKDFLNSVTLD